MEVNFEFFSALHEVTASDPGRVETRLNHELREIRTRNEARAAKIRDAGMLCEAHETSGATADLK